MEDRVKPIRITFTKTGETYELDFSRESIKFAEQHNFDIQELSKLPQTRIYELWYYAFRMHHRKMSKQQTDKLLEEIGGITPSILERLGLLYAQASQSNTIQDEEDFEKNGLATVEM